MNNPEKNEYASIISGQNETDAGSNALVSEYLKSVVERAKIEYVRDENVNGLLPVIEVA